MYRVLNSKMARFAVLKMSRACVFTLLLAVTNTASADEKVDFNREVRTVLANSCFTCHGPDSAERKAELRLDTLVGATRDLGGYAAVVPGDASKSEIIARLKSDDPDLRMPPAGSGKQISPEQIEVLEKWINQGAEYRGHWAYERIERPETPVVKQVNWATNAIDKFVLAKLESEGMSPSEAADRYVLIRRVALDLTGLPPTIEQVDAFVNDKSDKAYENLVDSLLESSAYGERWAVMWLDLARYADSAGYADDPPRTIWLYRDWVIKALNKNLPFDQFTIDQLAGDLRENPTEEQLMATAFHRNTLTNSEGGTNDEEFRNVAIVDRVNTTMQVWMGTTIRCAQCHNHKYDPLSQKEYFELFAFFNSTEDADRRDESPLLTVMTDEMKQKRADIELAIKEVEAQLVPSNEDVQLKLDAWKTIAARDLSWKSVRPTDVKSAGNATFTIAEDGAVLVSGESPDKDSYTVDLDLDAGGITGLQIEALAHDSLESKGPGRIGNFVLSELSVLNQTEATKQRQGRFVRLDLPGDGKMIHVAEVQVFDGEKNIATDGTATQSSTDFGGPPERGIDGNTDGTYTNNSVTHTAVSKDPWWEVDLGAVKGIDSVVVWNRTDNNLQSRLNGVIVSILDDKRNVIFKEVLATAPEKDAKIDITGAIPVSIATASADYEQKGDGNNQPGWLANQIIDGKRDATNNGWAVAGATGQANLAVLQFKEAVGSSDEPLKLRLTLDQNYGGKHTLGHFRISVTSIDGEVRVLPRAVNQVLAKAESEYQEADRKVLLDYYSKVVPPSKELTEQIAKLQGELNGIKGSTVPIMRELPMDKKRVTKIQVRGNFLITEDEVSEATPEVLHAFPEGEPLNRLGLARWIVSRENPLTSRVVVNRYWEALFGAGLVGTSEEFGTQGDLPSHPQLLDWLAIELMENGWDVKQLLKTMVMSATYRQSSAVDEAGLEADPANRLLARGPRFRMSAEMIRDNALAVSGLLSSKMLGPSVQPPRPNLGLKAAFGGSTDWSTSPGEDKYRRGLYTSWRRSIPYPSMAAFDAPSRNVCTISRGRTNTPLQALVTLNDPVYVEAAQALARRIDQEGGESALEKATYAFRSCLARHPSDLELQRVVELFERLKTDYAETPEEAKLMATSELGEASESADIIDLAAWTVVSNVLLNLDETLVKR